MRVIVHLDLDAFFAAVEILENPQLAGQPLLIGGRPEARGVVATASYPARAYGVHSAMPMARALALCPHAIVLPARHSLYRDYSNRVMDILHETAPLVEQVSIDEAYLDLTEPATGWRHAIEIARHLQNRVQEKVQLSASLGVATNKLVAKVASDRDKPAGLTIVSPGEEAAFLAPLPIRVLPGIGPVTAEKLGQLDVTTIGQLAQLSEAMLRQRFGKNGALICQRARGQDYRPVVTERVRKSASQENTFRHDITDPRALRRHLWQLSQGVARRLQRSELAAGTIGIKLRYSDFTTLTRQMSLSVPTDDARTVYRAALVLLRRAWQRGRPVRLLGVSGSHLTPPVRQLPLKFD